MNKPPVEKLHPSFLTGMARVIGFGDAKYDPDTWRTRRPKEEVLGSALRHLLAMMNGEASDYESGQSHACHVAVNLMYYEALAEKTAEEADS